MSNIKSVKELPHDFLLSLKKEIDEEIKKRGEIGKINDKQKLSEMSFADLVAMRDYIWKSLFGEIKYRQLHYDLHEEIKKRVDELI